MEPRTQIPDWIKEVGPGWHPILEQLHQDLLVEDPGYFVGQVKEKFGGLRVYLVSGYTPQVRELVQAAEDASCLTCEDCGAPGATKRVNTYYVRTLCPDCRAKILARRGLTAEELDGVR